MLLSLLVAVDLAEAKPKDNTCLVDLSPESLHNIWAKVAEAGGTVRTEPTKPLLPGELLTLQTKTDGTLVVTYVTQLFASVISPEERWTSRYVLQPEGRLVSWATTYQISLPVNAVSDVPDSCTTAARFLTNNLPFTVEE